MFLFPLSHVDVVRQDMVIVVFALLASSLQVPSLHWLGAGGLAVESASSSSAVMLVVTRKVAVALCAVESVASSFSAAIVAC